MLNVFSSGVHAPTRSCYMTVAQKSSQVKGQATPRQIESPLWKRRRMADWMSAGTKPLVSIWAEENIQASLDFVVRSRSVCKKIAEKLLGYQRMWQQCKTKVNNVMLKYRQVSDSVLF